MEGRGKGVMHIEKTLFANNVIVRGCDRFYCGSSRCMLHTYDHTVYCNSPLIDLSLGKRMSIFKNSVRCQAMSLCV